MKKEAVYLLKKLVSIQSFSGEEDLRVTFLLDFFARKGISAERIGNNLVFYPKNYVETQQTLMLNSHLDTVQPSASYTFDPFNPPKSDTKIYGLGSNDAGASVVAMIETFLHFYEQNLPFNLLLVLSAEEENSGKGGMKKVWKHISDKVDFAIIGEPTEMKGAIAERGLIVIDGESKGVSGHAAREEGKNALYIALDDILVLKSFDFKKVSDTMGKVKLSVTQINAGTQHNVVPDKCRFVVDIRPTEMYDNAEIVELLQAKTTSILTPRSLTNKSSATPQNHVLMQCAQELGIACYTSPTSSDWMNITCPALKMGVGKSARSHQADEFIFIHEIEEGVDKYIRSIHKLSEIIRK